MGCNMQVRSVQRPSRRLPQHRALRRCATVIRACATTIVADASRAVNSPSRQQMLLMRRKFSGGARAAERGAELLTQKLKQGNKRAEAEHLTHSLDDGSSNTRPSMCSCNPVPQIPLHERFTQHKQPTRRGGPVERTAERRCRQLFC